MPGSHRPKKSLCGAYSCLLVLLHVSNAMKRDNFDTTLSTVQSRTYLFWNALPRFRCTSVMQREEEMKDWKAVISTHATCSALNSDIFKNGIMEALISPQKQNLGIQSHEILREIRKRENSQTSLSCHIRIFVVSSTPVTNTTDYITIVSHQSGEIVLVCHIQQPFKSIWTRSIACSPAFCE